MSTKRDSGIKITAFLVGWIILIFGTIVGLIVWNVTRSWMNGLIVIVSNFFIGVVLLGLSQIMTYQEQQLSELAELKEIMKSEK
ncbi:MAG: hypothetical protein WCF60_03835 [Anaerobacillus sp.]